MFKRIRIEIFYKIIIYLLLDYFNYNFKIFNKICPYADI